jgi:methionine synthase II (cobalamin-independent)
VAAATGIGSLPGTDVDQAVALVFDALPDLPHLPELPDRGAGADMVGRSAAALVDLHVDLQPAGWRLVMRPGVDERRASQLLEQDLDALLPFADYDGTVKVQLTGPWTLAANLELPRGGKVLSDRGATRDVIGSLAETARGHLAEVRRRLPAATTVMLQLDEPSLPAVLSGLVSTESGFGRIPPRQTTDVVAGLGEVVSAAGAPVIVHCCAPTPPVRVAQQAGATAVSFDLAVSAGSLDLDEMGECVERGLLLWLGVVPAIGPGVPPAVRDVLVPVRQLWNRLGFDVDRLPESVALTPACGLAGASPGWARTALRLVAQAAHALSEAPETIRS